MCEVAGRDDIAWEESGWVGGAGVKAGNGRGSSPFEWKVRIVVWIEQTAQLGIPRLRRSVEPAVERFLRVEDDGLSVVQPSEAAARGRRHDRERPEWFGLACVKPPPTFIRIGLLFLDTPEKPKRAFAQPRTEPNEMTHRRESPSHRAQRTASAACPYAA